MSIKRRKQMMETQGYEHSDIEVSYPLDDERHSRGGSLLTAAMVAALILLLSGLFAPVVRAQTPGPVPGWAAALERTPKQAETDSAGFTLDRTEHDFGQVSRGDTVTTIFRVKAGDGPVVLLSASTDCGCTRAEFPKRPLRPGDTAQVKVVFAAKDKGNFRKTVRLRLHAGGREQATALVVKGTVQ